MAFTVMANDQAGWRPFPAPIVPQYDEAGRELPPGVPSIVDTNGNVVYVRSSFTTKAFQSEALKLVIQEANQVARELNLPENLPITESNIIGSFVGPFGFTYAYKKVGNITTKAYLYGVEQGNKFSDLTIADYDQTCLRFKLRGQLAIAEMDTNAAYEIATNWLASLSMDVAGLNRDCKAHVALSPYWNGFPHLGGSPGTQFVPIYFVWWTSLDNEMSDAGDKAHVELYAPTKTLLQLSVQDQKYILRKALVFTNLASLFPGVASVHTNYPVKTIYMPAQMFQ
jgi:hypothetical protein